MCAYVCDSGSMNDAHMRIRGPDCLLLLLHISRVFRPVYQDIFALSFIFIFIRVCVCACVCAFTCASMYAMWERQDDGAYLPVSAVTGNCEQPSTCAGNQTSRRGSSVNHSSISSILNILIFIYLC